MIDLRALFESGELHRLARTCRTRIEMCARLGLSPNAYEKRVNRLRAYGVNIPGFPELRLQAANDNHRAGGATVDAPRDKGVTGDGRHWGFESSPAHDDFADEEPTAPNRDLDTSIDPSIPAEATPRIPPGFYLKGESVLYDAGGNVMLRWEKTATTDKHRIEGMLAALPALLEEYKGRSEPVEAPCYADADLMAVYTMGDPHLGAFAWADEVGVNHDLAQAECDLVDAVDHLVSVGDAAETGVILSLGDFYHFDNENVTTTAGTRQDGDTRWTKVARAGIRAMRRCIDRALEKHRKVKAICVRGNHDKHSSAMLALALEQYYEREPRVEVDTSPDPFSWIRHGRTLIMATHGDEAAKAETLMGVMAADRPEWWGASDHRYILCGHLHHTKVQEVPGAIVERFPTLAPKDRYHHGHGYRAQQTMCVDTYHAAWGRINRSIVGVRQIRAARSA